LEGEIQAHPSRRCLPCQGPLQVRAPHSLACGSTPIYVISYCHVTRCLSLFRCLCFCNPQSRCGLCDTYYVAHVKNACAFLGDGMSRVEVFFSTLTLNITRLAHIKQFARK
jgi:hypothetical protein